MDAVTHVALRVVNVHEAEEYYARLFDLEVAWREAETEAGWCTLPDDKTWHDAEAAGIAIDLVFLWRDGFGLALEKADVLNHNGRLSHIGILVDQAMFNAIRQNASELQCTLQMESETTLVFDDRFDVRWEPTTLPFNHPRMQSSGARRGRWLQL
jgi:hypothetical protein